MTNEIKMEHKPNTKNNLEELFESAKSALAQVLPKHLTVERVIRIALAARSRNPLLMKCTTESILQSVMQASQLGLEAGGPLGHAYLVPFKNGKLSTPGNDVYECQMIPGYRGLIHLALSSGVVENIEAHVVHEGDKFSYCYGTEPSLIHNPGPGGKMTHVYCVVFPREGRPRFEVMNGDQVDAIRKR